MSISIIVAMSRNRVIGRENKLPWRLPEDLKHFKEITLGHPVIMGRKTFESIGKALPGRDNIVISRNERYRASGATVVGSLDEALALRKKEDAFVIGGEKIFRLALPRAEKLYITLIEEEVDGDTFFPEIDWDKDFEIVEQTDAMVSNDNIPYRFIVAKRLPKDGGR